MRIARIVKQAVVAAALVAGAGHASAGVMTFSGLTDFSNYSENGMNMVSDQVWNWPGTAMAHMDFGDARFSLASTSTFDMNSVDLVGDGGSGPARFSAYLDGNLLGSVDVTIAGDVTYNFGALFAGIDELRVSVIDGHFTFDNLVWDDDVAAVPEPASLALLVLGGIAFAARRRKQA